MTDIITTLHPENDEETNLYPNIKKKNIPSNAINYDRLDKDVKNLLNSINELRPSGVDTSAHILAFTYNKGIYIGTDTGYWYYWNGTQYASGGVYQASQLFIDIFNHDDILSGYELNTDGTMTPNPDWYCTDYIDVEGYTILNILGKTSGSANVFYNENKEKVSNVNLITGTLNIPLNAKYLKCNGKLSELESTQIQCKIEDYVINQTDDIETLNTKIEALKELLAPNQYSIDNLNNYFTDKEPRRLVISDSHQMTSNTYYQEYIYDVEIGDKLCIIVETSDTSGNIGNSLYVRNRVNNVNTNVANFEYIGNGIYYVNYEVRQIEGLQILLWAENNSYIYGVNIGLNGIYKKDLIYVDATNGNDLNNGLSYNFAKKTINSGLKVGTNLYIKVGVYEENIEVKNKNNLSLSLYNYDGVVYDSTARVIIRNINESLTLTLNNDLYECEYEETDENSSLYKVFIEQTLQPIFNVGGMTNNGYNATIFKYDGSYNSIALKPVLTKTECQNELNTFYYDGTKFYINTDDITNYSYHLPKNESLVCYFNKCNDVTLNNIQFEMGYGHEINLVRFNECKNVKVNNCIALLCASGTNFSTLNTNANFYKCESYQASADGYAPTGSSGVNNYYDCIGAYNKDDGVSHHNGTCGEVVGGEYHHNGKGGVASPTHGSFVDIYNVYSHDNMYGFYITASSGVPTKPIKMFNCVAKDNTYGLLLSTTYQVYSYNNKFTENTHQGDVGNLTIL